MGARAVPVCSRGGGGTGEAGWAAQLRATAPAADVRVWEGSAGGEGEEPRLEDVAHAVVWSPPPGLPARIVDPTMASRMASFVVCNAQPHAPNGGLPSG